MCMEFFIAFFLTDAQGSHFAHIFRKQSFFSVPFLFKGDERKMQDICFVFILRYIMFYSGLFLIFINLIMDIILFKL